MLFMIIKEITDLIRGLGSVSAFTPFDENGGDFDLVATHILRFNLVYKILSSNTPGHCDEQFPHVRVSHEGNVYYSSLREILGRRKGVSGILSDYILVF